MYDITYRGTPLGEVTKNVFLGGEGDEFIAEETKRLVSERQVYT